MLRRAVVALLLMGWFATAHAQSHRNLPLRYMTQVAPPSQQYPMVVLVTMGIGSLMWERHGHIALCVLYQNQAEDGCYNYGVGDFHDPGAMAWGFFRGTHSFWVEKQDPEAMLRIYRYVDRTIWAQVIPLEPCSAEFRAQEFRQPSLAIDFAPTIVGPCRRSGVRVHEARSPILRIVADRGCVPERIRDSRERTEWFVSVCRADTSRIPVFGYDPRLSQHIRRC